MLQCHRCNRCRTQAAPTRDETNWRLSALTGKSWCGWIDAIHIDRVTLHLLFQEPLQSSPLKPPLFCRLSIFFTSDSQWATPICIRVTQVCPIEIIIQSWRVKLWTNPGFFFSSHVDPLKLRLGCQIFCTLVYRTSGRTNFKIGIADFSANYFGHCYKTLFIPFVSSVFLSSWWCNWFKQY